jgi:serine protease
MRPVARFLLQLALVLGVVWVLAPPTTMRDRGFSDAEALVTASRGPVDRCHDVLAAEVSCDDAPPQAPAAVGPGRLVVDLVDGATPADLAALSARIGAPLAFYDANTEDEALAVADVPDLAAAIAALAGNSLVEAAEAEVRMALDDVPPESLPVAAPEVATSLDWLGWPDDPLYERQWNLRFVHAQQGWWLTPAGAGVIVAVIDTGVSAVEDLPADRLLPGVSFVPGVTAADDDNGHGTHVAGTIAQATNNTLGVAGMAPFAKILPVKVLGGSGGGTSEQVAAGIDWAADQGAQVINLSLGSPVYSKVVQIAAQKARARGVLIVAATGNDGKFGPSYPGALREVIGVSAFGPDGSLAPYSNWGLGTDISAPGGDKRLKNGGILQDTIDEEGHFYRELQGTSMATPHVAGALAALLSTGVLSPDQAEAALLAGADGSMWDPRFGHGRVDLEASIGLLGTGLDRAPRFALGAVIAGLAAGLGSRSAWFRVLAALVGGVVAGGVVGAEHLGGVPGALLARGVLSWPVVALGPSWGQMPVWISALLPLMAAFLLGPFRGGRPLAMGLAAGVGAHLAWGLSHGTFSPWWLPSSFVGWWLGVNLVICAVVLLALAGVERLDATQNGKGKA